MVAREGTMGTMSLNIKIPEAQELARQLAAETGESMARAVTEALRERLERVRRARRPSRFDRLMEIAREYSAHMSEEVRTLDVDKYLYDENGLPR
jgi:antitoxin VapB